MKRHLLAAAAAVAVLAVPQGARAQAIVNDPAHMAMNLASWVKQAQDMLQQYRMLEATYTSLSGARDVQGVAAALGGPARTWMPEASEALSAISGSGSMWGAASGLQRMARYLDVGQDSPWAIEMQRREAATANARAIAYAGLEDSQRGVSFLEGLLARVGMSEDVNGATAANGALEVESQNLQHHRGQIQQVTLMLMTEDRIERQRAEQQVWESGMQLLESTSPVTGEFR